MAGQLSWTFSFQGLDQIITKLQKIDGLINGISRKSGNMGAGGAVPGGTQFVGGTPSGYGMSSGLLGAAAIAATMQNRSVLSHQNQLVQAAAIPASSVQMARFRRHMNIMKPSLVYAGGGGGGGYGGGGGGGYVEKSPYDKFWDMTHAEQMVSMGKTPTGESFKPEYMTSDYLEKDAAAKAAARAAGQAFLKKTSLKPYHQALADAKEDLDYEKTQIENQIRGEAEDRAAGKAPSDPAYWAKEMRRKKQREANAQSALDALQPPVIPPSSQQYASPIGPNIKDAMSGQGIISAIRGAAGGAGGRIGGGITSFLGGNFAGAFKQLAPVLTALYIAFRALKFVVRELTEGIKHGAEAYQHAAKLGGAVGATFQATHAFKAIGMESPDMSVLQGQFNPRAKKFGVPDSQMILGAARAGQFGNVQQLLNMSKEFESAMKEGAQSARQMGEAAKVNQDTFMRTSAISREWKVMWAQIAAQMAPIIKLFQGLVLGFLKVVNQILEWYITVGKFLHIIPQGTDFKQIGGQMGKSGPTFTSWEKMGFVFSNKNGPEKQLQNIASNTGQTVKAVDNLAKKLGIIIGAHAANSMFGIGPIPSLP